MWVSEKAPCVFLANQKTGTRSVVGYLRHHFGCERIGPDHGVSIPPEHQKLFSFCFVRNPYYRTISLWWTRTRLTGNRVAGMELKKWIKTNHCSQLRFVGVDRVCKYEDFDMEFSNLPFFVPGSKIPHNNKNRVRRSLRGLGPWTPQRPPYEDLLSPEIKRLIAKLYEDDFDVLGYDA